MLSVGCTTSEGFQAATATPASSRTLTLPDTADDLLFVVRSDHGRVVLDDDGTGTLTMDDVEDVTWFSDRPARDAGVTTAREALRTYGWRHDGDALGADAPNATLTASDLDDALVVELLAASFDDGHGSFQVRSIGAPDAQDVELNDLDLFIDSTTADEDATTTADADTAADPSATERPDPATVAASAGFGSLATLPDHVTGLLGAVGAGPGASSDLTVQVAVRASYPLAGTGERGTIPVLLAPAQGPGPASAGISDQIEQWLSVNEARVDALLFDVTVRAGPNATPILEVRDVELSMQDVELPSS